MSFYKAQDITKQTIDVLDPRSVFSKRIIWSMHRIQFETKHIEYDSLKKIHIFAIGKAASYEVKAWEELLNKYGFSDKIGKCVAYTKRDHSLKSETILQFEGDHPYMSEDNVNQTKHFINELSEVKAEDTLIFLLSGGASALLVKPKKEISFSTLQNINKDLVNSGLNINKMNAVRKALSDVKNGGLLQYILTENIYQFVNCDIPDGDIKDVGSSPLHFTPLDTDFVNEYLSKFDITVHDKKNSSRNPYSLISSSAEFLLYDLGCLYPQAHIGKIYDGLCDEVIDDIKNELKSNKPDIHLSGGEGTLVVPKNAGLGGRSTHFVLQMAHALYEDPSMREYKILSIGTDGTDGPTDAAGAYIDYEIYQQDQGDEFLSHFDSYHYFDKMQTLLKTGPTGTNVMDLRFIWKERN